MLQYHGGKVFGQQAINNPNKFAYWLLSYVVVHIFDGSKFYILECMLKMQ